MKVVEQEVRIRTFDSLGLQPSFVKIDVQGHELEVLRGMEKTLVTCRPVLMLEKEFRFYSIRDYLSNLDYVLCQFDPEADQLMPSDAPQGTNYFAVHRDQRALWL